MSSWKPDEIICLILLRKDKVITRKGYSSIILKGHTRVNGLQLILSSTWLSVVQFGKCEVKSGIIIVLGQVSYIERYISPCSRPVRAMRSRTDDLSKSWQFLFSSTWMIIVFHGLVLLCLSVQSMSWVSKVCSIRKPKFYMIAQKDVSIIRIKTAAYVLVKQLKWRGQHPL